MSWRRSSYRSLLLGGLCWALACADDGEEALSLPLEGVVETLESSAEIVHSVEASEVSPGASDFVGSAACRNCHEAAWQAWLGSDHDRAMALATPERLGGPFAGETLQHFERTWRFERDGETSFVVVEEVGQVAERLRVTHVFGAWPLEQLLVDRAGGRKQALPVAWDSRVEGEGGQRWFILQPEEAGGRGDPLHWDGLAYNWNSQCASCHSTRVVKSYDADTNAFATRSSEIDVGCEACHGPGGRHVAHRTEKSPRDSQDGNGAEFAVQFDAVAPDLWQRAAGARIASRVRPRVHDREVETCAPCHSRRSPLVDPAEIGTPFLDNYAPALLMPGLYFDDGQIRDEVYVWGSFMQSAMHAAGVRCADCHDPHSLSLRREGNALCGGCHDAKAYDGAEHRGHAEVTAGTEGTRCVDCHMPEHIYMEIDARRDHSFPVPRPMRSAALGAPDPCRTCHAGKPPAALAATIEDWRGEGPTHWHWADRLVRPEGARTDARRWLELALDSSAPAIVRGSGWARYASEAEAAPSLATLESELGGASALERLGLLAVGERLDSAARLRLLGPLLGDPQRALRSAAAEALLDVPPDAWRPADRTALGLALKDYRAAQEANAERPEAQVNLGMLAFRNGDADSARKAYRRALRVAPYFVPAFVNLADLERALGREEEAAVLLEQALEWAPEEAMVRYAYGLSLHRLGRSEGSLRELERAAREDPSNPRLRLGWALALDAGGERAAATAVLIDGVEQQSASGDVFEAIVSFLRDEGEVERALGYVDRWEGAFPGDARVERWRIELGGSRPGAS